MYPLTHTRHRFVQAYEVLMDEELRAAYDKGLDLTEFMERKKRHQQNHSQDPGTGSDVSLWELRVFPAFLFLSCRSCCMPIAVLFQVSRSLSLTHTHTHTLSLSHTHTHTLSLSLFFCLLSFRVTMGAAMTRRAGLTPLPTMGMAVVTRGSNSSNSSNSSSSGSGSSIRMLSFICLSTAASLLFARPSPTTSRQARFD